MKEYPIKSTDGMIFNAKSIGVNHNASGMYIGGKASSYNRDFNNDDLVCLEDGIGDIKHCTIGDIKESYKILKEEILAKRPNNIKKYALCVQNTIMRCFGDFSNIKSRLSYFPSDEDIDLENKKMGQVSDLFHKNAAMCVERAMVAQNLLMEIGIKTTFKMSGVIINGNPEAHAYNIISQDDKYYIFDVTIPTVYEDKINPIICEIPKEVYDKIIMPNSDIGVSVSVSHFNPLQNKEYDIIYDAGRSDKYIVEESFTK